MPKTILVCVKNCGQRVAFQFDDHWPECHGMPMVREEVEQASPTWTVDATDVEHHTYSKIEDEQDQ